MTGEARLEQALDQAIDALRAGADIDGALRGARGQEQLLRPLVEVADRLRDEALPPPYPARLDDHWTIVRAAIERAEMGRQARREDEPAGGWRLRLPLGSMPARVTAALALVAAAGITGAAASALTTDAGAQLAEVVTPGWIEWAVPGVDEVPDARPAQMPPPATDQAPSADAPGNAGEAPGSVNQPTVAEVSGVVRDANGGTFVLVAAYGDWLVQMDANTQVTGTLADGAAAEVSGFVTAERSMHATSAVFSGGTAPVDDTGAPDPPADLPPPATAPGTVPGLPSFGPGAPDDPTSVEPTPTLTATPRPSDGDDGQDNGSGNGNGDDPRGGGRNNRPPPKDE